MSGRYKLDPKSHQDLFRVTDDLHKLSENPQAITKQQYGAILRRACDSFTRSLDNGFEHAIYELRAAMNPDDKAAARALFDNVETFNAFLNFEEQALINCGASKAMAADTVRNIRSMRETVATEIEIEDFQAERIVAAIKKSKTEICSASTQVQEGLSKEQAAFEFRKKGLLSVGSVILLTTVAVLTGGVALPGLIVPPAYLTASGLVGGWLITISGRQKDPLAGPAVKSPKRKN